MNTFIKKNKKVIVIGSIIVVAGVIAMLILKKKKQKEIIEPVIKTPAPANKEIVATGIPGVVFPIAKRTGFDIGMPAEQTVVKNIQKALNQKMTFQKPIPESGIFDGITEYTSQTILGVKTISYSLYKELISKLKI